MRAIKDAAWRALALCLGGAARLMRRQPSGGDADAWRAVQFSYSQFGEDVVVRYLLGDRSPDDRGWYVDIGAFDPVLHSNTYLLYLHGWRGLNVDANPARIARFAAKRQGDVSLAAVVSDSPAHVLYLEYPSPGTNRVVPAAAVDRSNARAEEPVGVRHARTETLTDILERHTPPTEGIDFLNIDCEGLDLAVLRGLDWRRWVPRVIAVEANTPGDRKSIVEFLEAKAYRLVSVHLVTLIFLHPSSRRSLPLGLWVDT